MRTEHIVDKKILIVDDDEGMLRAIGKVLSGAGAKVAAEKNASGAIEFLIRREKNTDLVITDLRMPVVNGATLVYAMRLIFPGLPVVVLTAFGSPELRAECLRQGAADFLEKTMSAAQLLEAVDHVFTVRNAGRERLAEAV